MVVMAVVWMMTACQQNEPVQSVSFPISICLPVEETLTAARAPLRKPGDPGTTEQFLLPRYIYIFIVNDDGEGAWKLFDKIIIEDATDYWHKEYYTGAMMGSGDSIYRYTREIIKPLAPGDKFSGRIYAIASAQQLTFTPSLNALTNGSSTETDVLNLQFSTAGTMQQNLQHVYATPYNYQINSKYYGSFNSNEHNVPYINLMLYHVASKVDITWSVAQNKRINKENPSEAVRLTKMRACNLFNGDAYCFRPMENSSGASPLNPAAGEGDTISIVTSADAGLWWEGRYYFYTIPYTTTGKENYYPLQMEMETNDSGNKYRPTINLELETDKPFVPWLRATFNLTSTLAAGTDSKDVNLPTP